MNIFHFVIPLGFVILCFMFLFTILLSKTTTLLDHFTTKTFDCHDYIMDRTIGKSIDSKGNNDPYMELSVGAFEQFLLPNITNKQYKFRVQTYSETVLFQIVTKSIVYSINERLFFVYQTLNNLDPNQMQKVQQIKQHEDYIKKLQVMFIDRDIADETYYFTSLHSCINPNSTKEASSNIKSKMEYQLLEMFFKRHTLVSDPSEITYYIRRLNNHHNYDLYHQILDYMNSASSYVYYDFDQINFNEPLHQQEENEEIKNKHKRYGEQLFKKAEQLLSRKMHDDVQLIRILLYRPERTFAFVLDCECKVSMTTNNDAIVEIMKSQVKGIQHQQSLSYKQEWIDFNNKNSIPYQSVKNTRKEPQYEDNLIDYDYENNDEDKNNDNKVHDSSRKSFYHYQKERNEKVLKLFDNFKRQIYDNHLSIYLLSYTNIQPPTEQELLNPKTVVAAPHTTTRERLYTKHTINTNNPTRQKKKNLLEYDYLDAGYFCYGKDGKLAGFDQHRKYQCESIFDKFGRKKHANTYDRPCRTNEECPFYRKNANYKNNRGGCHNGTCEMPVGIRRTSPRKIDVTSKPFCHNCKNVSSYECCLEQLNKTDKKYSFMQSPDYAFSQDFIERNNQSDILLARGLLP